MVLKKADKLAKPGAGEEQEDNKITHAEINTIIKSVQNTTPPRCLPSHLKAKIGSHILSVNGAQPAESVQA